MGKTSSKRTITIGFMFHTHLFRRYVPIPIHKARVYGCLMLEMLSLTTYSLKNIFPSNAFLKLLLESYISLLVEMLHRSWEYSYCCSFFRADKYKERKQMTVVAYSVHQCMYNRVCVIRHMHIHGKLHFTAQMSSGQKVRVIRVQVRG